MITTQQPLTKTQYIKTTAPRNIKIVNIVRKIFSLICALLLLFNLAYTFAMPVWDIPLLKWVVSETDLNEAQKQLTEIEKEFNNSLDLYRQDSSALTEDELSELEAFEQKIGTDFDTFINDTEEFLDTPSLLNTRKMISKYNNALELNSQIQTAINAAMLVILVFYAFGFIFAMFGILFKKQGLIITGHIFALLYAIVFSGILPAGITFVCFLTLSILLAEVNSSYRQYRQYMRTTPNVQL